MDGAQGWAQGQGIEQALTQPAGLINAGVVAGTTPISLIGTSSAQNRTRVGFSAAEVFDFLFKFVMALLAEIAKHDCCKESLGGFLADAGDTINIIQWLIMRAVDAVCGNLGKLLYFDTSLLSARSSQINRSVVRRGASSC